MEEAAEQGGIAGHDVIESHDVVGTAEVQTEHATGLGGHEWNARRIRTHLQAIEQASGVVGQLGVETRTADQTQRGQTGGHR
ncbi:hypothetical protein D3C81_2177200 [compost metagenome]